MEMEVTFSTILKDIMVDKHINLKEMYKDLTEICDMDITYASLYSYYTGVVVPPYATAKAILLNNDMRTEENELMEILAYSKEIAREERNDQSKILTLCLKIKPDLIAKKYKRNSTELKSLIEMRADELFEDNEELITRFSANGKRKLSAYVAYLIRKDLEENDYIKED